MPAASKDQTPRPRVVIGLVGGIGSGKSLAAKMFGELGCAVVDADVVGHAILNRAEIRRALVDRFGPGICRGGQVDREQLARLAFADGKSARALNAIMHPALRAELVRQIAQAGQASAPAAVLDAALLLETDWHELCDVIVFVDSPRPERLTRVAQSRGWTGEELTKREKCQKPLDMKRARADYVLENKSSVSFLHQQVRLLYQQLIRPMVSE